MIFLALPMFPVHTWALHKDFPGFLLFNFCTHHQVFLITHSMQLCLNALLWEDPPPNHIQNGILSLLSFLFSDGPYPELQLYHAILMHVSSVSATERQTPLERMWSFLLPTGKVVIDIEKSPKTHLQNEWMVSSLSFPLWGRVWGWGRHVKATAWRNSKSSSSLYWRDTLHVCHESMWMFQWYPWIFGLSFLWPPKQHCMKSYTAVLQSRNASAYCPLQVVILSKPETHLYSASDWHIDRR